MGKYRTVMRSRLHRMQLAKTDDCCHPWQKSECPVDWTYLETNALRVFATLSIRFFAIRGFSATLCNLTHRRAGDPTLSGDPGDRLPPPDPLLDLFFIDQHRRPAQLLALTSRSLHSRSNSLLNQRPLHLVHRSQNREHHFS